MAGMEGVKETKEEVPLYEEVPPARKTKAPAPKENDALFRYARGCYMEMTAENTIKVHWDNGAAIEATRGATVDYIEKQYWIHCTADYGKYDIFGDYNAMVAGNVEARLAWVVCMLREVIFSLPKVLISAAEASVSDRPVIEGTIHKTVMAMLKDKGAVLSGVIQQAFTIFVLNGVSLLGRGHHWNEDDNMWNRFITATKWDELMTTLGIANYEATIFHHAMHPFDYDWMAKMVSDPKAIVRSKVNGVAARRLGTLPAGTTALGLFRPLLDEIAIRNRKVSAQIEPLTDTIETLIAKIRLAPLNYCVNLARDVTAKNLEEVGKIEPIISVMYGYLKKLHVKNATAVQAKSLTNIAARHGPAFALGEALAVAMAPEAKDTEVILAELADVLKTVHGDMVRAAAE